MNTSSATARLPVCILLALLGLAAPASGQTALPIGAAPLPELTNTLWLYTSEDFVGKEAWITLTEESYAPGSPHALPKGFKDKVASMRWSLGEGVAVAFYTSTKGTGRQFTIFGSGSFDALKPYAVKDNIEAWAWFRVGGDGESTQDFPLQARALSEVLEEGSIRIFKKKNLEGEIGSIRNVAASPVATARNLDAALDRKMTSLSWNLPPGIVVVFYEKPDALGRRLSIWGSGELVDVGQWEFSDKAGAWAWFQVGGAPEQEPVGSPG